MIHRRVVWVGICLLSLVAAPSESVGASVGTTGASFLKLSVGARAEALGEAGVVGLEGIESLYWNPAGLATGGSRELLVSHQRLWQDVSATAFALGFRNDRVGSIALGFEQLGIDAWNNLSGESAVDARDLAVIVGFGRSLSERLAVGVAARTLHSGLGDHSASGFSVDCGLRYRFSDRLVMAGAVRNLGSGLSYLDADADPLPAIGSFGGAFRWKSLLVVGEARKERGIDAYGALGVEIRVHPVLALRAGSRFGSAVERAASDAAWGVGIGLPNGLRADYSYRDSDLGGSHQVSGTYGFGGAVGMDGGSPAGREYSSESSVPSNLVVVKGLLAGAVDSLLAMMPRPEGDHIYLRKSQASSTDQKKGEETRSGDDVLENILTEKLTHMGLSVHVTAEGDTLSDPTVSSAPVLEYSVLDLKVTYPSGGRRYYFGRKELRRLVWVDIHLRMLEMPDEAIQWAGGGERSYRDVVPFSLLKSLKTEGFSFTEAESEDRKWDRILEPVIATAIVGGLIYLFYSNKGSE